MRVWMLAGAMVLTAVFGANPADASPSLPDCNDDAVHIKVKRAIFKDLAALGLPVPASTRQTILAEIARLTLDDTPHSQEARRSMARAAALPMESLIACGQPDTPYGLRAVIVQNPRQTSQWGVLVFNYGVPNRAAGEQLEFLDQR